MILSPTTLIDIAQVSPGRVVCTFLPLETQILCYGPKYESRHSGLAHQVLSQPNDLQS